MGGVNQKKKKDGLPNRQAVKRQVERAEQEETHERKQIHSHEPSTEGRQTRRGEEKTVTQEKKKKRRVEEKSTWKEEKRTRS